MEKHDGSEREVRILGLRKWPFWVVFFPWLVATFILLRFEVRSFHLDETWAMPREERRGYFVKREFNAMGDEFEDDFLHLLAKAREEFGENPPPFEWVTGKDISKLQNFHAVIYSHFWLAAGSDFIYSPGGKGWRTFRENNNENVLYRLHYQNVPDLGKESILHNIHGKLPSYITRVDK